MSKRTEHLTDRHIDRSHLSRDLLMQYLLAMIAFAIIFIFTLLGAYWIYNYFDLSTNNTFFRLFYWLPDYFSLVIGGCFLVGWTVITYHFFKKPLKYLDEIIRASEKLANPTDRPIQLPDVLKNVQDQLNLVREQALRSAQAAREAEQRKNDLIVYLAHDLKTPLTSVIGYLTLLRDEPQISPELRARYTGIALDKAERLEELVNEFFDITRFNLCHMELERYPTDLTRMLEQIASEFEPIFKEKNLRYQLSLSKTLEYNCDPDKLARVFDNLLRNAFHYSFPDSTVEILGQQENDVITLTFSNKGKTIPAEKLDRLFEQFFRLDSSRATQTGGAGLGLSIAREIVELHGGTIHAASYDNHITFTIQFPLHSAS